MTNITYKTKEKTDDDVVAFIWASHLVFKGKGDSCYIFCSEKSKQPKPNTVFQGADKFSDLVKQASHKFYSDDEVTIKFV